MNSNISEIIENAFSTASAAIIEAISAADSGGNDSNKDRNNEHKFFSPLHDQHRTSATADGGENNPRDRDNQHNFFLPPHLEQYRTSASKFDEDLDDFQPDPKKFRSSLPTLATGTRNVVRTVKGGRTNTKGLQKLHNREVFGLPYEYQIFTMAEHIENFKIPRKSNRQLLIQNGLSGKLALSKSMSANQVVCEISNLFKDCFRGNDIGNLEFYYLSSIPGSKMLGRPKVNSCFRWDGAAVLSLSRTTLYVAFSRKHELIRKLTFQKATSESDEPSMNAEQRTTVPFGTTSEEDTDLFVNVPNRPTSPTSSNDDVMKENCEQPESSDAVNHRQLPMYSEYVNWLSSDEEDVQLQEALEASFYLPDLKNPVYEDDVPIEECLSELMDQIDEVKVNYFNVTRKKLLDGAIRGLKRKSFDEAGRISVKFSDDLGQTEGAIDAGGPTREFLRLVVSEIMSSSIFMGAEDCKLITKCKTASSQDHYYLYGRLLGLSVLHGGPGPNCFSSVLYNQVLERPSPLSIELLTTTAVYKQVKKIDDATTEDEFEDAMKDAEIYLEAAGCVHLTLKQKDAIVEDCVQFFVEVRIREELKRFTDGLNVLGLRESMRKNPQSYETLFLYQADDMTASKMLEEIFANIQFALCGSNARSKQNDTICFWRDYIMDVEDGSAKCRLCDIMTFVTGASRLPPLGFAPKPSIQFSNESKFPTSNTCANILTLPMVENGQDYESFKENMDFAILNSPGFGVA